MRLALLASAALLLALPARSQDVEIVVTFDRATSSAEALRLVHGATPSLDARTAFDPVRVGATLDVLPEPELTGALFATGALSVEVTRVAAQMAAHGLPLDPDEAEARGLGGYTVLATYPSTLATGDATALFEAATGMEPTTVEARADELRDRAPSPSAQEVMDRLRSVPGVLAVRAASPPLTRQRSASADASRWRSAPTSTFPGVPSDV